MSMGSNSDLTKLFNVKVPWWSRYVGAYRAWQRRKNAHKEIQHIATVYAWTWWSDAQHYDLAWYICKVDGTGRRFYEYGSKSRLLEDRAKKNTVYAHIIAPWVNNGMTHAALVNYAKDSVKQPTRTE